MPKGIRIPNRIAVDVETDSSAVGDKIILLIELFIKRYPPIVFVSARPSVRPIATFPKSSEPGVEIAPATIVEPDLILPNAKS